MSQRFLLAILLVPLSLTGCFRSHGIGDDAGPRSDAGPTIDSSMPDSSPRDASPRDAGDPDACDACFCNPAPADLLCDFSHVIANRPNTIPVALQGCFCEGHVDCAARVTGDHILELTTSDCSDPDIDCDACNPFLEGTCELPPLDEGLWQVDVNGLPSFQLQVTPEDVLPERGATCLRRAATDESCGVSWPPGPVEPGLSCHPTHALPNQRVPITVSDPCGGCGIYAGPCKVDVFDDVIRVQPSALSSLCDIDCPAICVPREDVCWTPRLAEGTWRVFIEGLDYESTLEVGPEPSTGEICGPVFPHD